MNEYVEVEKVPHPINIIIIIIIREIALILKGSWPRPRKIKEWSSIYVAYEVLRFFPREEGRNLRK